MSVRFSTSPLWMARSSRYLHHVDRLILHHQFDGKARITFHQRRQAFQQFNPKRNRRGDTYLADRRCFVAAEVGLHAFDMVEHDHGVFVQAPAIVGEAEMPRGPVERSNSEMLLKLRYLSADGRLAGIRFTGNHRQ